MILLHYGKYYIIGSLLHYILEQNIIIDIFQDIPLVFMAAILKIGIRTPLGILNGFLARSNDLKNMFITLLVKFITLSGSITLLVNFFTLSRSITLLVKFITLAGSITLLVDFITLSGSITLSGVYYSIGAKYYN